LSAGIFLPDKWREVDCFLKIAIEESRFDVDLVAFQIEVIDQRGEDLDGVSVGNRCKELIEVDSFNLRVFLGDTSSLVVGCLACIFIELAMVKWQGDRMAS
jgi:hypothetical protein